MGTTKETEHRKIVIKPSECETYVKQVKELITHLTTCVMNMKSLMEDEKDIVGIFDVGVVVSIASAGTPDCAMLLGNHEGIATALKSIKESAEEIDREEFLKNSEKDNG